MKSIDLGELAYVALLEEVSLDFKPGLVCAHSNGSHHDMTIETFKKSAKALLPHFQKYQQIAQNHQGTKRELFDLLRKEGQAAENSMFEATQGINTHKGINFIMAILIGATALVHPFNEHEIKQTIKDLTKHLYDDFINLNQQKSLTHGQKIYLKHGIRGIRQEAMLGFPVLFDYPFSQLINRPKDDYTFLFGCMQVLTDTTIIHRSGIEGLHWTQNIAETLSYETIENQFLAINKQFVDRWISPGGSADFLSAAIFLFKVKQQLKES